MELRKIEAATAAKEAQAAVDKEWPLAETGEMAAMAESAETVATAETAGIF